MIGSNHPGLALPKGTPKPVEQRWKVLERKRQREQAAKAAKKRDGGRCQACKKPGGEAHHVVYRSHGGKDELRNLVTLCTRCHQDAHAKLLIITATRRGWKCERPR